MALITKDELVDIVHTTLADRARPPQDANPATHPAPLTAVERADVVEALIEAASEVAEHADGYGLIGGVDILPLRDALEAVRALKAPRS